MPLKKRCFIPVVKTDTNWSYSESLKSIFSSGATAPSGPGSSQYRDFTITLRHTTISRTPLDKWSAQCRELYLSTHNTHKWQTCMSLAGFEPTISASEQPETHALDRMATGIGIKIPTALSFSNYTHVRLAHCGTNCKKDGQNSGYYCKYIIFYF
jgi:hypothetical protein